MKWKFLHHFAPEIPGFTHAAMPTYHDGWVYFSPRDSNGHSHIYRSGLDLKNMKLDEPEPVLQPGKPGELDDAGCMISCFHRKAMYYIGWNRSVSVPFRNSIGAYINGRKVIKKDRNQSDPIGVGSCWEGTRWYLSLLGWDEGPRYHIVNDDGSVAIPLKHGECAIARPCVHVDYLGWYHMWYCYRGDQYKLGYAVSQDGYRWERKDDEAGVIPSGLEFDSEAQCYPCVFSVKNDLFMLYNGNGYGRTGFGIAVLD